MDSAGDTHPECVEFSTDLKVHDARNAAERVPYIPPEGGGGGGGETKKLADSSHRSKSTWLVAMELSGRHVACMNH